jgi:sigma-B regulation protein RsbU (phosphoserine phosphatase)
VAGAIFLFIGLAACSIGLSRRQAGMRTLTWLGVWSALYGAAQLSQSTAVVAALPHGLQSVVPYVSTAVMYLLPVAALLAFRDLSLGGFRTLVQLSTLGALAVGVAGILLFVAGRSSPDLMPYNNVLAAGMLVVLAVVAAAPGLASRFLALKDRRVLVAGILVFALEALYNSLSRPLGFPASRLLDHVGFGFLLASFGFVALQLVFANERRLLAVENELEIASRMQMAILPDGAPEIRHLRMAASYRPMTAVAGDYFDFIPVDGRGVGVLVADVAGHGVAAALIASMIKVAVHSVASRADDPAAVMGGLNRILSAQPGSQMISAAYLWLEPEQREARYSAAGHPPLLAWRQDRLERLVSNGLLIGMLPECDYPVCTLAISPGDRFLLYTDGVTDVENGAGEFFGDSRLEAVVRENLSRPPAEFSDHLLAEIDRWRPEHAPRQDDITFVVVDIEGPAAAGARPGTRLT